MVPNYMAGLLTVMPFSNSNQLPAKTLVRKILGRILYSWNLKDDAAALAALLFMASTDNPDSFDDSIVSTVIPRSVLERANLSTSNWRERIKQKLAGYPSDYYGTLARLEFLSKQTNYKFIWLVITGFIEKWPLYGSSFYFVTKCKAAEKTFKTPVVAVNKDGLKILASTTMETIWNAKLNNVCLVFGKPCHLNSFQIRSSRKYSINGNGFLDVNIVQENEKSSPESKLSIETDSVFAKLSLVLIIQNFRDRKLLVSSVNMFI